MKKVKQKEIKNFLIYMDSYVTNEKIFEDIMEIINIYINDRNKNLYIDNNNLIGRTKKVKDSFVLEIEENCMKFINIMHDGRSTKELVLKKENEITIVEISKIEKTLSSKNKTIKIKRLFNQKKYIDNQFRYELKKENIISTILEDNTSSIYVMELYVDENRKGVTKEFTVSDINDFSDNDIIYRSTDFYYEPPFNTREKDPKKFYIVGMKQTSKEEFNKMKNYKKLI